MTVAASEDTAPRRLPALADLLLGQVFSWRNLAAYGVGVLVGVAVDRLLLRTTPRTPAACPPNSHP
jgi:hypothetical protein